MSAITQPAPADAERIIAETDAAVATIAAARSAIGEVIYGQESVIDRALITILAGGHGLLIGVPGLAKTKLVETLGTVLGLSARRIQFTPDLMPSDIIGSEVMDQAADGSRSFRFLPGPVFAQLLMADEINRASPRTQSALLQSMQEYHVTVAGVAPRPAGAVPRAGDAEPARAGRHLSPARGAARPLPPADRRGLSRPRRRAAHAVRDHRRRTRRHAEPVLDADGLRSIQQLVRRMPVGESVVEAILELVRSARPGTATSERIGQAIAWGPGPRASQALMLACARPRADRRALRAVARRRRGAGRAGPSAPHGARLRRPRRWPHRPRRDRRTESPDWIATSAWTGLHQSGGR